ncbi:MAG: glycosyltransferase family 4 protein [Rikenellaceae bacterium]
MRKILVSAYGCEPEKGSEQGVGWNWVLQMARHNKVYVITKANNQYSIEANLPEELVHNIEFYYYDTAKLIKKFKNKAKGLYFYYFCWQIGIVPIIRQIIKLHNPNYTMHLTFGSLWMPTLLPFFNKPFIWGPIGGGDCEPEKLFKLLPLKQRLQAHLRLLLNKSVIINPFIRFVCSRSVAIICRTKNTGEIIPRKFKDKLHYCIETAIEPLKKREAKQNNSNNVVGVITTGRLTPSKNIITAIRAVADLKELDYHYTIIGDGVDKERIKKEISRYDLQDRVTILNHVSRSEVIKNIQASDIFLFPSLREGGSWSLMEAMGVGLPVVCLNWSGMAMICNDKCAIRLSPHTPKQLQDQMRDAISKLIKDSTLRNELGDSGYELINERFNWSCKGEFIELLFNKIENRNE